MSRNTTAGGSAPPVPPFWTPVLLGCQSVSAGGLKFCNSLIEIRSIFKEIMNNVNFFEKFTKEANRHR